MLTPDQQQDLAEARSMLAVEPRGTLQWHSARRTIQVLEAVNKASEARTFDAVANSPPAEAPTEPGTIRMGGR